MYWWFVVEQNKSYWILQKGKLEHRLQCAAALEDCIVAFGGNGNLLDTVKKKTY